MTTTATYASEITWTSAYATCGLLYSEGVRPDALKSEAILRPVFGKLWELYDKYIKHVHEIPWWHTERSIVGHLTAAAFSAGHVAIEEYTCARKGVDHDGKESPNRNGRADFWLMNASEHDVLVETKAIWLSKDAHSWDPLQKQLKVAADQVKSYEDAKKVNCNLAVCFTRPYWKIKDKGENTAQRKRRLHEDPPELEMRDMYDYCSYYWLNDEHLGFCEGEKNLCPALLIYCKEL